MAVDFQSLFNDNFSAKRLIDVTILDFSNRLELVSDPGNFLAVKVLAFFARYSCNFIMLAFGKGLFFRHHHRSCSCPYLLHLLQLTSQAHVSCKQALSCLRSRIPCGAAAITVANHSN